MATAVPINLTIEQGTDFIVEFNLRAESGNFINLFNYTVTAKMARNYTTSVKYSLNPTILNPTTGLIRLSMPDGVSSFVQTTNNLKEGRYVYSVYINGSSGTTSKVVEGIITVVPGVL